MHLGLLVQFLIAFRPTINRYIKRDRNQKCILCLVNGCAIKETYGFNIQKCQIPPKMSHSSKNVTFLQKWHIPPKITHSPPKMARSSKNGTFIQKWHIYPKVLGFRKFQKMMSQWIFMKCLKNLFHTLNSRLYILLDDDESSSRTMDSWWLDFKFINKTQIDVTWNVFLENGWWSTVTEFVLKVLTENIKNTKQFF